jgi:hypothetical protein
MFTTMAFLKARDGITRDEFIDYYEHHHVPLILSLAPPPEYYARNYLPAERDRRWPADFGVITHMKFASRDSYEHWRDAVLAQGSPIPEDEARFVDRSKTRSYAIEEHITTEQPSSPALGP